MHFFRQLRIPRWIAWSLATIVLWGLWGIQSRMALDRVSPWVNQVLFPAGLIPPVLWLAATGRARHPARWQAGALFGFITGVFGGLGNIAFYLALAEGGKVSIVTPITSLFPLVTVVLARLVLHEAISRSQAAGVILSIVAIAMLGV